MYLFALFLASVLGREITFPPRVGIAAHQELLGHDLGDVDIVSGARFRGLTTFANLNYVECFTESGKAHEDKFDIAILGAPFDTVSTCFRSLSQTPFLNKSAGGFGHTPYAALPYLWRAIH